LGTSVGEKRTMSQGKQKRKLSPLGVALICVGLLLIANFAYFVKSAAGIDLDPGRHHGNLFPLGDFMYQAWLRRGQK